MPIDGVMKIINIFIIFMKMIDYKLDESRNTRNSFNLSHDGGLFFGLHDNTPDHQGIEPFPIRTDLLYPNIDVNNNVVMTKGSVISVPILSPDHPLPESDNDICYDIKLVTGNIVKVAAHALTEYVDAVESG